jgi:tetratricopeptide (TPR) repeat protein
VLYFIACLLIPTGYQEGTVSTTKLTRKEISADPIHDALVSTIEILRARAKIIAMIACGVILIAVIVYFGLGYLEARDSRAQQELGRAMDYYHGLIDDSAKEDPYAFGPSPVFRSDEGKYRAAKAILDPLVARYGSSKAGVIGRYYLGLCQLRLGQKNEGIASLEAVAKNTSERTVGYLAKKLLAAHWVETGNGSKGQEIIQGMLKDPQCDLPKEDLQLDLARAFVAQGKRAEALKVLQEAQESGGGGMLQSLIFQELSRLQGSSGNEPRP